MNVCGGDQAAGDTLDQPVRFGMLGELSDFLGRMSAVVVVDRPGDDLKVAYEYRGSATFDRPDIDDVLAELDALPDNSE